MQGEVMIEKSKSLKPDCALCDVQTYHINGRAFIVQPVFKESSTNSLGAILLRLMEADCPCQG